MENFSVVLFILAVVIVLLAAADKLKMPYPVLLIAAGVTVGFIPALPDVELHPDVIFLIFLPPLLYDAAFHMDSKEFKTHIRTIGVLSIPLVFITATGIAITARLFIPRMSWPLSFVLGALLSATDAVAAISITKGLGLPRKTVTILEGESLFNDASALIAYRFALAAVTGATFLIWKASLHFVLIMAGGLLIGLVMGKILAIILTWVHQNAMVTISFMLLMPFVTYLLAEELKTSGVIAVVTLGLGISQFSNKIFPRELKQESKSIWGIIIFLLNGLIFILIGFQLPNVSRGIQRDRLFPDIGYALLITLVALLLRTGRIFLQKINLQRTFRRKKDRFSEQALLDFKNSLIISWAGMRGIVSLAIAIGIPETLSDGSPFPERDEIIFISVVVVLFTIIGQGLSLPWLVRKLKIPRDEMVIAE